MPPTCTDLLFPREWLVNADGESYSYGKSASDRRLIYQYLSMLEFWHQSCLAHDGALVQYIARIVAGFSMQRHHRDHRPMSTKCPACSGSNVRRSTIRASEASAKHRLRSRYRCRDFG